MSAGARRGESKRVDGEEGASGRSRTGEGDGSEGSGATGERRMERAGATARPEGGGRGEYCVRPRRPSAVTSYMMHFCRKRGGKGRGCKGQRGGVVGGKGARDSGEMPEHWDARGAGVPGWFGGYPRLGGYGRARGGGHFLFTWGM